MITTYPRIAGYTYNADVYCPDCILPHFVGAIALTTTEDTLDHYAKVYNVDRNNESSFDSDEFPKVIFRLQLESHEHCARCGERL